MQYAYYIFLGQNLTFIFRGVVSIDIELDSIEVDQCDFPETKTIQEAKEKWKNKLPLSLYGTHRCRHKSTKVTRKHACGVSFIKHFSCPFSLTVEIFISPKCQGSGWFARV